MKYKQCRRDPKLPQMIKYLQCNLKTINHKINWNIPVPGFNKKYRHRVSHKKKYLVLGAFGDLVKVLKITQSTENMDFPWINPDNYGGKIHKYVKYINSVIPRNKSTKCPKGKIIPSKNVVFPIKKNSNSEWSLGDHVLCLMDNKQKKILDEQFYGKVLLKMPDDVISKIQKFIKDNPEALKVPDSEESKFIMKISNKYKRQLQWNIGRCVKIDVYESQPGLTQCGCLAFMCGALVVASLASCALCASTGPLWGLCCFAAITGYCGAGLVFSIVIGCVTGCLYPDDDSYGSTIDQSVETCLPKNWSEVRTGHCYGRTVSDCKDGSFCDWKLPGKCLTLPRYSDAGHGHCYYQNQTDGVPRSRASCIDGSSCYWEHSGKCVQKTGTGEGPVNCNLGKTACDDGSSCNWVYQGCVQNPHGGSGPVTCNFDNETDCNGATYCKWQVFE